MHTVSRPWQRGTGMAPDDWVEVLRVCKRLPLWPTYEGSVVDVGYKNTDIGMRGAVPV